MSINRFNESYFIKHNFEYCDNKIEVDSDLELIVTIPAYKEKELAGSIESLLETSLKPSQYLILVLLNHPADANEDLVSETQQQYNSLNYARVSTSLKVLPTKHAGVGLARKILMDSAAKIFADLHKPEGVIMAYDADCLCRPDHMAQVLSYFKKEPSKVAASIYYEHDLSLVVENHRDYIIDYELHLRTYINWKKYIGLPYGFQTIGSSMAVRGGIYTLVGGMNKRKAGEDFYFLHKFTTAFDFGEIRNTTVYPSSRISDRVPFGTGRAILQADQTGVQIDTYNPQSYLLFYRLLKNMDSWTTGMFIIESESHALLNYLEEIKFKDLLSECFSNTSSKQQFVKRFFNRFDAFQFMKYLHYLRNNGLENVRPLAAANALLEKFGLSQKQTNEMALLEFRIIDKTESVES